MIVRNGHQTGKLFRNGRRVAYVYKNRQMVFQNGMVKGVDYESFQWLKSDGNAVIDLGEFLYTTSINHIKCRLSNISFSSKIYQPAFRLGGDLRLWRFQDTDAVYVYYMYLKNGNPYNIKIDNIHENKLINLYNDKVIIDDIIYDNIIFGQNTKEWNVSLFCALPRTISSINNAFDISIFDITTTLRRFQLTPIKLLRNITAAYSADKKMHFAGECGMFDAVSETFYGNVNPDGGLFYVSNI